MRVNIFPSPFFFSRPHSLSSHVWFTAYNANTIHIHCTTTMWTNIDAARVGVRRTRDDMIAPQWNVFCIIFCRRSFTSPGQNCMSFFRSSAPFLSLNQLNEFFMWHFCAIPANINPTNIFQWKESVYNPSVYVDDELRTNTLFVL